MANNRLYLRCRNCGEDLYLDKNFGDPYFITEEKRKEINQFLENHAFCGEKHELAHGGWFELYDEYHDSEEPLTRQKYQIIALIGNALERWFKEL